MSAPAVSVVVEWENVVLCEAERSERMLDRLAEQVRALGRPVEVIVACDPGGIGLDGLTALLVTKLGPSFGTGIDWRIVTAGSAHYYDLKNRGVEEALGELIVFLDSDVIPDDGWLAELLQVFSDPAVQVVAGHTYVEAHGLYSAAMSLGWFFPRRSETAERHDRATHFWANNVAFRAAMLRAHPFPTPDDGSTRGACADLATLLRREGVRIWTTTAAQVSHPPPNGARHFFVRAVAEGRDGVLMWIRAGKRRYRLPVRIVRWHLKAALRAFGSIASYRRTVRLPLLEVPPAWAIMGTYYGVACLGALATLFAPGPMSRRFRI